MGFIVQFSWAKGKGQGNPTGVMNASTDPESMARLPSAVTQ